MNRQRRRIILLISLYLATATLATLSNQTLAHQPQEITARSNWEIQTATSATKPSTLILTRSPMPLPRLSLRSLAYFRGIRIGAAVAVKPLLNEELYAQTLARQFNLLTPENAMKFERLHPLRDRYDFEDADTLVNFAQAHNMQVRGHTLVWHNQLPEWLTEKDWERDELINILREHIITVVEHYRGQLVAWDVVNEAIADDGSLRDTLWLRGIGPEYIEMAFRWAQEADPNVLLFYNDYGGEGQGKKSDAIYALVKELRQRGVPIHGVGLQMHVKVTSPPTPQAVAANLKRLSALDLAVGITEMDVRIKDPPTEAKLEQQARVYSNMLDVCLAAPKCNSFVLWGVSDRHSWIPKAFEGWKSGLIFDQQYRPKPAYRAIIDQLTQ